MAIYNYKCELNHFTEWWGKFDDRPKVIECEYKGCERNSHPSFDGLAIYTPAIEGGTGGGVHMKQKGSAK